MYIPYNKLLTIKGYIVDNVLHDETLNITLPLKYPVSRKFSGYIKFYRNPSGACVVTDTVKRE